jgi:hypothetical protein
MARGGKEVVVTWVSKAGGDGGGKDGKVEGRVVVAVGDVLKVASIVVYPGANSKASNASSAAADVAVVDTAVTRGRSDRRHLRGGPPSQRGVRRKDDPN